MAYSVKEIFYSLQGEGVRLGRPSVFCRFSGCNLWSGREIDRPISTCWFCDTDFVGTDGDGGGKFASARDLAAAIASMWPSQAYKSCPYVVFTGGEPTLQLDQALVSEIKGLGFEVAIETNGTREVPAGVDWITVSPKSLDNLTQRCGSELKLLFPFAIQPDEVEDLKFSHYCLSPLNVSDAAQSAQYQQEALDYCLTHPQWQLTLQAHKVWNVR